MFEIPFVHCPFWVQIHGAPFEGISKENARKIGSRIGSVLAVEDPIVDNRIIRGFMRVKVSIDITKPLVTGFWVPRKEFPKVWVMLLYEKLQDYCYNCGCIGHDQKECRSEKAMSLIKDDAPRYGSGLRVSPLRPINTHPPRNSDDNRDKKRCRWNADHMGETIRSQSAQHRECTTNAAGMSEGAGENAEGSVVEKVVKLFSEQIVQSEAGKEVAEKDITSENQHILANRLKVCLSSLISDNQSAFVSKRLIQDNILVAQEVFLYLKHTKSSKMNSLALKLDMYKAYDCLEWDFVHEILMAFGFKEKWVKLIKSCISTVSYQIKFNGRLSEIFSPKRGLRQGDPLSPYLFILAAECLSRMLSKSGNDGSLSSMVIGKDEPRLTHLFFADDAMIMCKGTRENCF